MSFIYLQKHNNSNMFNYVMDEPMKERKINFIKSVFNFASYEEIDIALQDCEGDETLVLYKMSFSMYLEDIRQIIKERQLKVYLSRFITDEQKEIAALYKNDEVETISPIPSILNETLTCSSSSTKSRKWSEDEDILFMKRLEEFGHHGSWGEFSLAIPGRNGYQCRDHFKALVKRGCIKTRKSDESTSSNTGHGYKTLTGPSFSVESFDFDKIEILQGWSPIEHLKNKFGQHVRFLTFNDAIAELEHVRREWPDVKNLSFIVRELELKQLSCAMDKFLKVM
ncbi:6045_t:CDS:2 [Rhizophagus irregularis]|nr:6045_t:CDS:2 [Rhizophagus irregularis]